MYFIEMSAGGAMNNRGVKYRTVMSREVWVDEFKPKFGTDLFCWVGKHRCICCKARILGNWLENTLSLTGEGLT